MKNIVNCKNCNEENPYYYLNCKKCSAVLRERVVNIDLWKTLLDIIEKPVSTFKNIVFAQHKNFQIPVFLFSLIKLFVSLIFISVITIQNKDVTKNIFEYYGILGVSVLSIIVVLSFVLKYTAQGFGISTRIKDNISILVFSFIPYVYGAILLFPIEVIVFGKELFSFTPSPYELKPLLAYVLTGFEILLIVWAIILNITSIYAQTKSKLFSIISALIINIILYSAIYQLSILFYKS